MNKKTFTSFLPKLNKIEDWYAVTKISRRIAFGLALFVKILAQYFVLALSTLAQVLCSSIRKSWQFN